MANKRILVVDDEKDITSLLRLRLEASGYDVLEAYDGQNTGIDAMTTNKA